MEAGPLLGQLLGQPVVPVDVNLDREGEPSLDPHVNPAEFRVQEVVVHHPLGTTRKCQTGLAVAVTELDRAAAFEAAQYGNQSAGQLALPNALIADLLFW